MSYYWTLGRQSPIRNSLSRSKMLLLLLLSFLFIFTGCPDRSQLEKRQRDNEKSHVTGEGDSTPNHTQESKKRLLAELHQANFQELFHACQINPFEFLTGPKTVVIGHDKSGNRVEVLVDGRAALWRPVAEIQAMIPTQFDDQGRPLDCPDPTIGGLFPNGDLFEKLSQVKD